MHVITVRNVASALPAGVAHLLEHGRREESRAGPVLVVDHPVTTAYRRPCERVLFSAVRDANPFLHLYEAIWMLGGRDDAAPLARIVKRFADFAEPDGRVHGAYGHRWRQALGFDQLDHVVEVLRRDPTSRQCVLQMWNAQHSRYDTSTGDAEPMGSDDLAGFWRDRPCNTHIYLRVREERWQMVDSSAAMSGLLEVENVGVKVLDLTVLCRSNDVVWGAYGANAVHFSVLQEYLAARIGVGVGTMYQVSNNFHAYVSELERLYGRARAASGGEAALARLGVALRDDRYDPAYGEGLRPLLMFEDPGEADAQVTGALRWCDRMWRKDVVPGTPPPSGWMSNTLGPAMLAHYYHRRGDHESATNWVQAVESPDWRVACNDWLRRRKK